MPSIYKQFDKKGNHISWRATVRITGHPCINKSFKKKAEAKIWAQSTENEVRNGTYTYGKEVKLKMTVGDLIERYIEEGVKGRHKSEKTSIRLLNYFKKNMGDYALRFVTTGLILMERAKLLKQKTSWGTLKNPNTINRYIATLSGAFRYACKCLRWIDTNPCLNILTLKINPKERRVLNQEEVIRLIAACKESESLYLYPIVLMALTTGARRGELLKFTWKDIDFENNIANISESKNGKPRKVGLVKSVINELKPLYNKKTSIRSLLFPNQTQTGGINFRKSWECALKRAKIKDFVFHGLRHHFCTFGGQIGASSSLLQFQLGHSSSKMTDHYTHHDAQASRFIGEEIEKRIEEK